MIKTVLLAAITLLVINGCGEKEGRGTSAQMKCGTGKCGTNMFDGNSALAKKKKNILSQMSKEDTRRQCVIGAKTTKLLYDCVRNPKTQKLSLKCGSDINKSGMKCGAGKCGSK